MFKEWPLVAFTVLGQMAVGLFWSFHLPFLVRGRLPSAGWRASWLVILGVIALLMALAAAVSFFHLRHPVRARRALGNLRTSWLSREILFELVFTALVVIAAWLGAFHSPARGLQLALLAGAGMAGGLFLLSMAKLYMLPSVPVWEGSYTPLSFLSTTLVLGAVSTELTVRVVAGPGAFEIGLVPVALVLVVIEILLAILVVPRHGLMGVHPAPSLRPDEAPPRFLHGFRTALLAAALVSGAIDLLTGGGHIMNERGASPALLLMFLFVLASEIAGRFQFYGLVRRPGD